MHAALRAWARVSTTLALLALPVFGMERLQPPVMLDSLATADTSIHQEWVDSAESKAKAGPILELQERTVKSAPGRTRLTATQSENILKGKDLDRTRGLSLGDALEAVPGVTNLRTGSTVSKPVIRGMQGSRIVILNNGVRQEGQQWGSEHAPEVDPFLASQITVVKGASSVRYGADALGGVVLVEPWPLRRQPGLGGEVHTVGFSNTAGGAVSGTLEGSPGLLPGLGWRIQGTAKKIGNAATPRYLLHNTASEDFNYSAALGWQDPDKGMELFYSRFDTRLGIFSGSHIGSVGDLNAALGRDVPETPSEFSYAIDRPYQEVVHRLLKARAFHSLQGKGKLSLTYSVQDNDRSEFDHKPLNDALAAKNNPELRYRITTHSGNLAWERKVAPSLRASAGLSGMARFNVYEGRPFIPNFLDVGGGAFATGIWQGEAWEAEAGLRYDYRFLRTYSREKGEVVSSAFEFQNPSAMAGVAWHARTDLTARLHLSTAFRPPGVNELFSFGLHHGAAAVEYGDRNLGPERAYDFTSSLEWKRDGYRLEISAYHTYVRNYISLVPELPPTLTIRGAFPTFRYRQTGARLQGSDIALQIPLGATLKYAGKISLLRAWEDHSGKYLLSMPSDRFENGLACEVPAWRKLRDLHLGASLRTVLKQTHTPADRLDYAPAPDGYTLVNLRAGLAIPFRTAALHLDVEVSNLLDTPYRDYTNRFRYYADDPGRSVIVRLKLPFEASPPLNR
jgi:iron complex outermembrane receptor protein